MKGSIYGVKYRGSSKDCDMESIGGSFKNGLSEKSKGRNEIYSKIPFI